MIKRIIGLIVTVAVLFVLVMTILHAGSYRSMIWDLSLIHISEPTRP